ncbi:MAG: hypothetical protein JO356_01975 [Acidobacteria bacterium]|nr:hypothetical protein [Acidobacteriota bacterium]
MPARTTRYAAWRLFLLLVILSGARASAADSSRKPVEVFIIPFSHLDLFWGGTREECLARGNRIIGKAIAIASARPDFRFLLESDNFVAHYLDTHRGSREVELFIRLVKEGRIEIAPNWANIFLNQPDGEVLTRNILYGKRYARSAFGVDPQVLHPADIPGFPPQLPQILVASDIPFLVITRLGPADQSLFRWESPAGPSVLVWNAIRGYAWGIHLHLADPLSEASLEVIGKDIDQIHATTAAPIYMHWGLDLWAPTDRLVSNVEELNRSEVSAHFRLATPEEYFKTARQTANPPHLRGEIPLGWPHIIDSILHLWQLAIPASTALEEAETFAAVNYALGWANYPREEFESLWKALIESMDHNHDGQGGEIGDSEKIGDSERVILAGGEILRHMLANIAERVAIPIPGGLPIVVFNPVGWERDDLVHTHVTLFGDVSPAELNDFKGGMRLLDPSGNPVAFSIEQTSDNISRALDLSFIAQSVPPLGYKAFFLVPNHRMEPSAPTSEIALDRDRDQKDPRRPLGNDVIENTYYRVTVDKATGRVTVFDKTLARDVIQGLDLVGVEERGTNNVQREIETGRTIPRSLDNTVLEENSPIQTIFKLLGNVGGIPVVQRLILYKSLKRLDIENSVNWNEARLLNIEMLIPVAQNAEIHYGVPFGVASMQDLVAGSGPRAEDEIQRDSWQKYRTIQSWITASTAEGQLTVAADHPLVKIEEGLIRANMVRGQRYTSVRIVRHGTEVSSIQFPPPGQYVFRYSLSSGSGDWKMAHPYQIGKNFVSPLIAVSVVDEISAKSLPAIYSFASVEEGNLVISALKKSEDDGSLILRLYETAGTSIETSVKFMGNTGVFRETNLLEENAASSDQTIVRFKPFEIKTLRLDPRAFRPKPSLPGISHIVR